MNSIIAVGSSHLSCFDETSRHHRHHALRNKLAISNVSNFYAYPGLNMLGDRSKGKQVDFNNLKYVVQHTNASGVLLVNLSNDWERFLTTHGQLMAVNDKVLQNWGSASIDQRKKWSYQHTNLSKINRSQFQENLDAYASVLKEIFGHSNVTDIFQMSVLERRYTKIDNARMDVLFATLNSYLKKFCNQLILYNRHGQKIKIHFVSVSDQFIEANSRGNVCSVFRKSESELFKRVGCHPRTDWGNYLVHRNVPAYMSLFTKVNEILGKL